MDPRTAIREFLASRRARITPQIRNGRGDLLAANPLGVALFAPVFDQPTFPMPQQLPNTSRRRPCPSG